MSPPLHKQELNLGPVVGKPCPTCGTAIKALFTGTYCPNDCDRKPTPIECVYTERLPTDFVVSVNGQEIPTNKTPNRSLTAVTNGNLVTQEVANFFTSRWTKVRLEHPRHNPFILDYFADPLYLVVGGDNERYVGNTDETRDPNQR